MKSDGIIHLMSYYLTLNYIVLTSISPFFPHSCQEVLLDSMTLGPNIAKNAALRENVFMMAICIELWIPLFLVGKPGSSKSLAKSIVQSSMQGAASNSELLRGFKQANKMISVHILECVHGILYPVRFFVMNTCQACVFIYARVLYLRPQ